MISSSNAVLTKARAMYASYLTTDHYKKLLQRRSLNDVVTYLKNETAYKDVLNVINENNVHRGQLEYLLNKEYYERTSRLIRYAPKSAASFYNIGVMYTEIELLVTKLITMGSEEHSGFDLDIPSYLISKASYNLYGLISVKTYEEVLELVKNTRYYDLLVSLQPVGNEPIDYNILEIELKRIYYKKYISIIKKNFKGKTQKELLTMLYTVIELQNITKIYRFKKYFSGSIDVIKKNLILDYSRMGNSFIDELINTKDIGVFLKKLAESKYRLFIDNSDYVFIEYHTEKIKYNLAKRFMRFSSDPAVVYMTYSILLMIEIDNLKHIIEGIRYDEPASSIEKILIY